MIRRVFLIQIAAGEMVLPADQAHHLRDVLRLMPGEEVEVFDAAGFTGRATLIRSSPSEVVIRIGAVEKAALPPFRWTIASAIPKSSRADWMIEKLSELGTGAFIPLLTDRSVVEPKGETKIDRWKRLAGESAKQCRRGGVMEIQSPARLDEVVGEGGWYLSLEDQAVPIADAFQSKIKNQKPKMDLLLFIGPEGGWSPREVELFRFKRLTPVALTATILRVETAAIAAAAVLGSLARTMEIRSKGQAS